MQSIDRNIWVGTLRFDWSEVLDKIAEQMQTILMESKLRDFRARQLLIYPPDIFINYFLPITSFYFDFTTQDL